MLVTPSAPHRPPQPQERNIGLIPHFTSHWFRCILTETTCNGSVTNGEKTNMKTTTTQKQNQRNEGINQGTDQLIQQRAYELYLKRGQKSGHELEDWLQAERDVRNRPR